MKVGCGGRGRRWSRGGSGGCGGLVVVVMAVVAVVAVVASAAGKASDPPGQLFAALVACFRNVWPIIYDASTKPQQLQFRRHVATEPLPRSKPSLSSRARNSSGFVPLQPAAIIAVFSENV